MHRLAGLLSKSGMLYQTNPFHYDARYNCRVQSLRRPDAAQKGNNVALFYGPFEGSFARAASERVTLIQ